MKEFSKKWINSKAPRKQRKYRANAPKHLRRKMMAANLSAELRKKYGRRSFAIRSGDKVKIMRGEFAGKMGKVEGVDVKRMKIFVEGAEREKGEGQPASKYPIDPSNVKLISLELGDTKRKHALSRGLRNQKISKEKRKAALERGKAKATKKRGKKSKEKKSKKKKSKKAKKTKSKRSKPAKKKASKSKSKRSKSAKKKESAKKTKSKKSKSKKSKKGKKK